LKPVAIRVLVVEDSVDDADLLLHALRRAGYQPEHLRVETREAMLSALDEQPWDAIVCDFSMPHFSAPEALKLVKEKGLDLPFIIVSGTVGEDVAVVAMRAGAHDYLMKDNLTRLGPAIQRELREVSVRRECAQAEKDLRTYQEQLRSLASRLSLIEEQERRQIATALHDQVGQTLAVLKIKLAALRVQANGTELAEPLDTAHGLCEQAINFTRSLTFDLSPPVLYQLGLEAAVEWLVEKHSDLHGIAVELSNDGLPKPLSEDIRVFLFQAVRELLVNTAKHAGASTVGVSMKREEQNILILVEDDGNGFDPEKMVRSEGFGLFNIRERLNSVGGGLLIESIVGSGSRVTVLAPLMDGDESHKGADDERQNRPGR
jgi:signal transduction histidine kinase